MVIELHDIRNSVSEALEENSFDATPQRSIADNRVFWEWYRRAQWKIDAVRIAHFSGQEHAFDIAAVLYLPAAGDDVAFGAQLDGRTFGRFRLGGSWWSRACGHNERVQSKVVGLVPEVLSWFQRYAKPEQILRLLRPSHATHESTVAPGVAQDIRRLELYIQRQGRSDEQCE
jgi:hypothetical protein